MLNWFQRLSRAGQRTSARARPTCRPSVECLETRSVPSATGVFRQTNLVSDEPGVAPIVDPNVVNAWGIALGPNGGTLWISDNGTGVTTLYVGGVNGSPFTRFAALPVVTIPGGAPTGQVFNGTTDFVVGAGTAKGPAIFIFASESGQITGWNPAVPPPPPSKVAQPAVAIDGAVFKGIALANNTIGTKKGNFLYATDFHGGKIDVFDAQFHAAALDSDFFDPNLPAGYAPFNIQALGGKLYVTYAVQDADKHDDVRGAGHGIVDVFDTDGHYLKRLVTGGALNSPWGLALAPADFGKFGNDLLVGNFGDGRVNAYDPNTGKFLGALRNEQGQPLTIPGLWGLGFGNGVSAGDKNTLFFTAGPGGESHGLIGQLKPQDVDIIAAAADAGGSTVVNVLDAATGKVKFTIPAFNGHLTGGVRVAVGDVNGDGVPDVIAGTGPGVRDEVRVFDGQTGRPLPGALGDFFPYGRNTNGVFVAAGDVNGDGYDDVIVGPDAGQAPLVEVFGGKDGKLLKSFLADTPGFKGGVRVAAGDVNGDGKADVITGLGAGDLPLARVFSGADFSLLSSILVGDASFRGGVFVAAGDLSGSGKANVIASQGAGGTTDVRVFNGQDGSAVGSFAAENGAFKGGVRVATIRVGGKTRIVTADGPNGGATVSVFDGQTFKLVDSFTAGAPSFRGGLFVGGGGH